MVYRVYVEKKPGLQQEAAGLLNEFRDLLGIAGLALLNAANIIGKIRNFGKKRRALRQPEAA